MTHLIIEISPRDIVDMFLFACAIALVWPMILIATLGLAKKNVQEQKLSQSQMPSKQNTQDPMQ